MQSPTVVEPPQPDRVTARSRVWAAIEILLAAAFMVLTKLHIPEVRRGLVPRPRLVDAPARTSPPRLSLVSAPPGFGRLLRHIGWPISDVLIRQLGSDKRYRAHAAGEGGMS